MTRTAKGSLTSPHRGGVAHPHPDHPCPSASVAQVSRATVLLAVAAGASYHRAAAARAGRRSAPPVAALVARFNQLGLAALDPPHGGGPAPTYTRAACDRILAEAQRTPDRTRDGTATWSLTTLQRALRRAPDGLPLVSRFTIWAVLRDAGWRWQRNRRGAPPAPPCASARAAPLPSTTPIPYPKT